MTMLRRDRHDRLMRLALRAAALVTLCGVAVAAFATELEADRCMGSEWPLDVELDWMKASSIETLQSGAKLSVFPSKAFAVVLAPSVSAALPAPPSGKPHGVPAESWA